MDECGIERTVNITMKVGEEALAILRRFHAFAPERFSTIAWMDWNGLHHPVFSNWRLNVYGALLRLAPAG